MGDGPPGADLVQVSPYGPLFGMVLRAREVCNAGRYDEALADVDGYEQAARAFGDEQTVDFLVQLRMYTYLLMDLQQPAMAVGEELLARHQASGNLLGEAKTLADLAELFILNGRLTDGMRYLARSSLLLEGTNRRNERYVSALCSYGDAATAAGLYEAAAAFYEDYSTTYGPDEDAYLEHAYTTLLVCWALWLDHLGHTHEAAQRLRRAVAVVERWLTTYDGRVGGDDARLLTGVQALAFAKLGDGDRAIVAAGVALGAPQPIGRYQAQTWMAHLARGVALRDRGDLDAARREMLAAQHLAALGARAEVQLLLRHELAALTAQALGHTACADLVAAVSAQAEVLWRQRRQRVAMLGQARQREEVETERARAEAALLRDPLTGLGNRRHFDQVMAAAHTGTVPLPLSLLIIDVDRFKEVNDTHSHSAGDTVLREIAEVIGSQCRTGLDVPIRYAGDEFTVFLRADLGTAVDIAERIRAAVAAIDFAAVAPGTPVSVSTGVAAMRVGMSAADLFQTADGRLYQAKRAGRDRVAA